jgi:Na+/proline symporter
MGGLLLIYTMSGGAKAVANTQKLQLMIIFSGMFLAAYMVVKMLPDNVGFTDALHVSGKLGKLNVISTGLTKNGFDWSDQYNLFSGIIGGFFLMLSYFGADQSQVGRYLTARSLTESRIGLLMNGLVKIPMQFAILLIGALLFTFYQFNSAPIFFNGRQIAKLEQTSLKDSFHNAEAEYGKIALQKKQLVTSFTNSLHAHHEDSVEIHAAGLTQLQKRSDSIRVKVKGWMNETGGVSNDTNYIFLRFVLDYLPAGLVGLLIAIIFLASWGSIAAAINSLASCTMIDFHRKFSKKDIAPEREYALSKWYTLGWGIFCIIVAMFTYNLGNSLIETVNVLGSLFYGVILGVFVVAFFLKNIRNSTAVFLAAILAEIIVLMVFSLAKFGVIKLGFLWLNPVGVFFVIFFSYLLQPLMTKNKNTPAN